MLPNERATTTEALVLDRLVREPATAAAAPGIRARVEGGLVTLAGAVRNHAERLAAGCVAGEIPGVRWVSNQLEVVPPSLPDRSDTAATDEPRAGEARRTLPRSSDRPAARFRR